MGFTSSRLRANTVSLRHEQSSIGIFLCQEILLAY